jgi:hypothetical protein
MHVNVSRSKLLINNKRNPLIRRTKSPAVAVACCNHCGGAIKPSGEMQTCIMCGREVGHVCSNCSHAPAHEPA